MQEPHIMINAPLTHRRATTQSNGPVDGEEARVQLTTSTTTMPTNGSCLDTVIVVLSHPSPLSSPPKNDHQRNSLACQPLHHHPRDRAQLLVLRGGRFLSLFLIDRIFLELTTFLQHCCSFGAIVPPSYSKTGLAASGPSKCASWPSTHTQVQSSTQCNQAAVEEGFKFAYRIVCSFPFWSKVGLPHWTFFFIFVADLLQAAPMPMPHP